MSQLSLVSVTLIAAFVLAVIGLSWIVVRFWRRWRGSPEQVIRRISRHRLGDIVIPDGMDGEIHVDHLLLTGRGILVLDVRSTQGIVFAGEKMDDWTVLHKNRRFTFRNPLGPLAARVHAVRDLADSVPVIGRVVFVGDVEFPGGHIESTVRLEELEGEFGPARSDQASSHIQAFHGSWGRVESIAQPAVH